MTYRYRFSPDVNKASPGLYSALMDELSTAALFSAGLPASPGVSLQMHVELLEPLSATNDIDIVNTVTKLGKKVSHTRTYFYCVDTDKALAYATHVKYMPTGSWFLDWMFGSKVLYNFFTRMLVSAKQPSLYEEKSLVKGVIQSYLEFHGVGRATFHVTREHTNPFGAMHGGCQAMVMEQVAESYAKEVLKQNKVDRDDNTKAPVVLESLQIEFLVAIKGPSVEVVCETLGKNDDSNILHVRAMLKDNSGRLLSDSKLRFAIYS